MEKREREQESETDNSKLKTLDIYVEENLDIYNTQKLSNF